jgi:putative ABC transport system permease protein
MHDHSIAAHVPREADRASMTYSHGITLRESLRIAFTTLTVNKLRSFLTALGVIIGVAAVVALMALGRGAQEQITQQLTENGANLLTVIPGSLGRGGFSSSGGTQTLTVEDAEALADPNNAPSIAQVSPEENNFGTIAVGSTNTSASVYGVTPAYLPIHNNSLASGEFFSESQVRRGSNVAVLGSRIASTLFGGTDPVGQYIRINGQRFRVIGVLASKGGNAFFSPDDSVFVPISTSQHKLFGAKMTPSGEATVGSIAVQARDQNSIEQAKEEIAATLRRRHKLATNGSADDFTINNQQDIINTLVESRRTLTIYLGAIASISLIVGGIGIMNIMLVSVRERTREIGLRKAIGARERDILTQFLIEAMFLSIGGGCIGLLVGIIITVVVNTSGQGRAILSMSSMLLAVAVATAIGLFFGIEPARRAAQLNPIEALRYE